jgi:subfamily B ATP-binding cassette protein HlyB/CyaB
MILNNSEKSIDTGLIGLALIANFHQIPVNIEKIRHNFGPAVKALGEVAFFGEQEIILSAKSLGFKVKQTHLNLTDIDDGIMPALCKNSDGKYFILVKKILPSDSPSAIAVNAESALNFENSDPLYLVHLIEKKQAIKLPSLELTKFWDGNAILFSPRKSSLFGKLRKFNLGWFVPSLIKYRTIFYKVLLASFIIQLFGLITPLFFQVVMDKVLVHTALTTLNVLAIGFVASSIAEVILNATRNYIFSHTTTRIDVELGARLFEHLIYLPLSWFEARQTGQSVARVRELDTLRNFITSTALTLIIDLFFTVIYFVVMWFYSHKLTIVVLLSLPFYIILSLFITPILKTRLDRKFHYGAINQSFLVESITGVETIKSMALEPQMRKKWENNLASYVTANFRAQNLAQIASQGASFIQKLTTVLIIWFGAHQVMEGNLTVGQLVAFNMIAGRISGPILKLSQLWQDFQQVGISLKRLGDILNAPIERGYEASQSSIQTIKGNIKFENVNFRYRPDSSMVIDDLSFEIYQNEIIGIVGASGSGKSTLAKLIQKLYNVESGRILLDNFDVSTMDIASLRRQIGIVLQDSILFSGTIRENIALSNPGISMDRIIKVAQLAGAHQFIVELPDGYDTQVGERGCSLSGGQQQRLAIARILINDPRILIFDEATSSLDYVSELVIKQNMKAICAGRTVIIIAHRLSAVENANRIFVIEKGKLLESGPPKKLIETRGAFYNMVKAQSKLSLHVIKNIDDINK